jgi:hypothetical protein
MAEVPPEQITAKFGGKPNFFAQTASGSNDSKDNSATGNAQLPKGVVLDKDGKPYVATSIPYPVIPQLRIEQLANI